MRDVEQLSELPARSRMAWSTRPVWDRRAPNHKRRSDPTNLDRSGRVGGRYRADRRDHQRTGHVASATTLVGLSSSTRGRHE